MYKVKTKQNFIFNFRSIYFLFNTLFGNSGINMSSY